MMPKTQDNANIVPMSMFFAFPLRLMRLATASNAIAQKIPRSVHICAFKESA